MQFELIPEPDADLRSPLKIFATPGGAEIRVVTIAGEPWFVAKDIAERLDYIWNGSTRIEHVPEEWRRVTSVVTLRGDAQEMAVLSEQGMYFFLARSDKPKALSFQKWIAGEVIPAIRKTGSYSVGPAFQIPTTLADALQLAADQARQIDTQAAALAIAAPKVAAQELLAGANGAFGLIEAGKQCGMGRDAFIAFLLREKILYGRPGRRLPFQEWLDKGYFKVRTGTAVHEDSDHAYQQPQFTARGIAWIAERIAKANPPM
jgi:prophage antirepressor-like protein